MLNKFWQSLKSGTDIRGVACCGIENEDINLTDDVIEKIILGFGLWLCDKTKKSVDELTVAIGHDSRISAQRIKTVLIRALSLAGINVIDCSLSSTPAMFMTTVDLNCDAAIQITASHHPFNRNGLKFFIKGSGLEGEDIKEILEFAQDNKNLPKSKNEGKVEKINYMDTYCEHIKSMIKSQINAKDYEHPLAGFKIIVDAGNGAGGFYASDILKPLGADILGSQFLDPDGMFPNHIPNPEDECAMQFIKESTIKNKADLGIIFDTDVDRVGAVDSNGKEINRNRLIALASAIVLKENPKGIIVTDSITSTGLQKFIEGNLSGVHHRFKRGYKNVINEAKRLNDMGLNSPLAMETSGHAAFKENYFLDDGAYLITKVIIEMVKLKSENKKICDLLTDLEEPVESLEIRMPILEEDFKSYGEKVINDLTKYSNSKSNWHIDKENKEGIRVSFDKNNGDGWFLIRLSVHDPIMPLNIESDSKGGVKIIMNELLEFLKFEEKLDSSKCFNI